MGKGALGEFQADAFTVKNTFVDIGFEYFEEDDAMHDGHALWTRQTSEPAISKDVPGTVPTLGAIGRGLISPPEQRGLCAQTPAEPERERILWSLIVDEPEQEIEPRRQFQPQPFQSFQPLTRCLPQPFISALPFRETHFDAEEALKLLGQVPPPRRPAARSHQEAAPGGAAEDRSQRTRGWQDASPGCAGRDIPADWAETTTVMMRNLPNKYSQQMLKSEIDGNGFEGKYDFLYLPMDMETHANKGYAFINFLDPAVVWEFKVAHEGKQMKRFNSSKFVSVSPAALQGYDANYAHYSMARCNRGDPDARPLFLRSPDKSPATSAAKGADKQQRRRAAKANSLGSCAASPQTQPSGSFGDGDMSGTQHKHQLDLAGQFQMSPQWSEQQYDQQWQFFEWPMQQQVHMVASYETTADGHLLVAQPCLSESSGQSSSGDASAACTKLCVGCGQNFSPGHRFCGHCGASLPME